MKKQFLLLLALMTFGFASAQDRASDKIIAEVLPEKDVKTEISKTEKKANKNRSDKKAKKSNQKNTSAVTKAKRYYIDSSGQKTYVE